MKTRVYHIRISEHPQYAITSAMGTKIRETFLLKIKTLKMNFLPMPEDYLFQSLI